MTATSELIQVLGGERVLGKVHSEKSLEAKVRRGLPFGVVEALMKAAALSREQTERIIGIPARTLSRRKIEKRIPFEEADRVLSIAEVLAYSIRVLGGTQQAAGWLHHPSPALDDVAPIERLNNALGRKAVSDELKRIAYGLLA